MHINKIPYNNIEVQLTYPLYEYQLEGVAKTIRFKRAINGDDMGLGKTIQAIAAVEAISGYPALVICPASLKYNWQDEWEKWTNKKAILLNDSNKYTWPTFINGDNVFGIGQQAHVCIVNYESLSKYFVKQIVRQRRAKPTLKDIVFEKDVQLFKTVIIDEAHRVKEPTALQSKLVYGICQGKEYVQELTGTPVVNSPKDLMSQLAILNKLGEFGGVEHFTNTYLKDIDPVKGTLVPAKYGNNLEDLNAKLNATCYFRREKKEVLKDLPDKLRHIVPCDIDTKQEYNDAIDDLAEYLRKYKQASEWQIARSMRGEVMVRIGILKQVAARGKIKVVTDYVKDVVETGQKIIVFCHHKEIVYSVKALFPNALTITGDDNQLVRDINKKKFQNDPESKIIICSIKAAGVGLTLTAATNVLFVELPWHPADTDQAEDRAYRNGQKDNVHCIYFLGRGTIDTTIYSLIERKRSMCSTITGAKDYALVNLEHDVFDFFMKRIEKGNLDELKIK